MTALRKELMNYFELLPESKLKLILPICKHLACEEFVIETDLTEEEKLIIAEGREEYKKGTFTSLKDIT